MGAVDTGKAGKAARPSPPPELRHRRRPEATDRGEPTPAQASAGAAIVAASKPAGAAPPSVAPAPANKSGNGESLDKDQLLKLTPSQRGTARETGALPSRSARGTPAPSGPSDDDRLAAVDPRDETVPMSPLRKRVAERLVQAQTESASLTTFNEVDMTATKKDMKPSLAPCAFSKLSVYSVRSSMIGVRRCGEAVPGSTPR